MDTSLFLEQFGHLAQSPGGVGKLRNLILDLAVRGKLVEQNPDDEPASELLKRIEAEKQRLVEAGAIKKSEPLPPIHENEMLYQVPDGWEWVFYTQLAVISSGATKGRKLQNRKIIDVPYLRVANVQRWFVDLSHVKHIQIGQDELDKFSLQVNDILQVEGGDWDKVGRAALWQGELEICIHQNHIFKARLYSNRILPRYMLIYLNSEPVKQYYQNCSKQTTNLASINQTQLKATPIALPPLAEQQRIVARVDELMQLCDQLEAEQTEHDYLRERAAKSTLFHLTSAPSKSEARHYWGYAERHFPALFDRVATVQELRATILQLAVQGRLVPQNPDDEPARELLKRIEVEKQRLVEAGEIKPSKPLPPIREDEMPYELPSGWEWVRLGYLSELENGDRSKNYPSKDEQVNEGIPFVNAGHLQNNLIALQDMNYITEERYELLRSGKIKKRDILFCLRGSLGKFALVDSIEKGAIASSLIIIRAYDVQLINYFQIYLGSPLNQLNVKRFDNGTAQPNLSGTNLALFIIPLPPFTEQQRIVAKVDELMQLCDQLEAEAEDRRALSGRLFDSVVHHLFAEEG